MQTQTEERKQLAAALGRVASGVFVLTVRHARAETGMLASWVQQCAFEPPHVSVAIKRTRPIIDWLKPVASFILNVVEREQKNMISHFGHGFPLGEPAFDGIQIERHTDGTPPQPLRLEPGEFRRGGPMTRGTLCRVRQR